MNEELLKAIYEREGFSTKATFDEFKRDIGSSPELRRTIYDRSFAGKASFQEFETDLGLTQTPVQSNVQLPVQQQNNPFYDFIGKVPVIGGALQKGVDAFLRGFQKGAATSEAVDAMFGDLTSDEAEAVAQIMNKSAKEVEGDNSVTKKFTDEEGYSLGSLAGALAEGVVESTAMMGRSLWDSFTDWKTASIVGGITAAGAAAFAARGAAATAITGPGTAAGAGVGAVMGGVSSGLGATSGLLEASQVYYEEMRRELQKRGLPLTKENILKVNEDPEWLSATRDKAVIKGGIVGAFDALSGFMGAKMGASAVKSLAEKATIGQTIKAGAMGALLDSGAGVAGEYVSSQAIGEPAGTKELILEANPFGPATITSVYSFVKDNAKIVGSKLSRTEADKTDSPITMEEKFNSEIPLGPSALIQAVKEQDPVLARQAIGNLATVLDKEEFDAAMTDLAVKEGLSAEELSAITAQFDAAKEIATSFNTPELQTDPERTGRAVAEELAVQQVKIERAQQEELKNASHPSLHPEYDARIAQLDEQITDGEETVKSIVTRKETPVSDDPEFFRQKREELQTNYLAEEQSLTDKQSQLFEIGKQLEQDILQGSQTLEEYQNSKSRYVTAFDDNPLQEQPSNPVRLKTDINSIGNAVNVARIPDFVLQRLGNGDISAGKAVIQQAKTLFEEIKGLQTKLTPKERGRRKSELTELGSREETLRIRQNPVTNEGSNTTKKYYQGIPKTTSFMQGLLDENGNELIQGSLNEVEQYKKDKGIKDENVEFVDLDTSNPNSLINKFLNPVISGNNAPPISEQGIAANAVSDGGVQDDSAPTVSPPITNGDTSSSNDGASEGVNPSPANSDIPVPETPALSAEETPRRKEQINNAAADALRSLIDETKLNPNSRTVDNMIDEAMTRWVSTPEEQYGREIALSLDAMEGRALDAPQQLAIGKAISDLRIARERNVARKANARILTSDASEAQAAINAIDDRLDTLTRGLRRAGGIAGEALGIRSKLLDFTKYDRENMIIEFDDALKPFGKTSTAEDKQAISDSAEEIKRIEAEIAGLDLRKSKDSEVTKRLIAEQQARTNSKKTKPLSKQIRRSNSLASAKSQLDKVLKGVIC